MVWHLMNCLPLNMRDLDSVEAEGRQSWSFLASHTLSRCDESSTTDRYMALFPQHLQVRLLSTVLPGSTSQLAPFSLSSDDVKVVVGIGSNFRQFFSHWIFGSQLANPDLPSLILSFTGESDLDGHVK